MFAFEGEVGVACVLEARVMPIGRVVAGLALLPATAIMRVVGFVTAKAGRWRARKSPVLVAIQACCLAVLAQQRVVCRIVIELRFGPFGRFMTGGAVVIHSFLVGLVIAVTGNAVRRRFTVFFIGFVTIAALGFEMRADGLEVGERMIKGILVENHDFRVTPFVVGMA